MPTPDLTFTEARNETLATVINALDNIVSMTSFEFSGSPFSADEEGVFVCLSRYNRRSEEDETFTVHFTWGELLNLPNGSISGTAIQRWEAQQAESLSAEARERAKREAAEQQATLKRAAEWERNRETREREELAKLITKYGVPKSV